MIYRKRVCERDTVSGRERERKREFVWERKRGILYVRERE